jgi:RNA polymerase sigma-70 factor, ECF subfamily
VTEQKADRPRRTPEDPELVRRAQEGDGGALELLVRRHEGPVYRFLVSYMGDEDAAADVAQDTFVKAMSNLGTFRGDAAFRTWLMAIARNEARGWARGAGRRKESPLEKLAPMPDGAPGPEQEAIQGTEVDRVKRALTRLPEKQRMSVALRIFDGLSFREVAELTDSTEGAARVNYHHGIRRLREWLDERSD